jgi:predicted Co/Zn/Cd cation transporter (cation efflux family)
MSHNSSDLSKSVLNNSDEIDILPIDMVKLSDDEILQLFPNMNEEQIDKLKSDLIVITQILYKKYR